MTIHRRKFSPRTYAVIVLQQGGKCACGCREKFEDVTGIHFDHILPLWLGGKDEPENLQALLSHHHATKTSREATARAKVKRIQAQGGLRKPKMNAQQKALAKMTGIGT